MASPRSGTSSGSSLLLNNSGSEEDLQLAIEQMKKRKRMISNCESARRSRMRKQRHLDDLVTQASQLRKENGQVFAALRLTAQHCAAVEAENSVLRAQATELGNRFQSLNEILKHLGVSRSISGSIPLDDDHGRPGAAMGNLVGPWTTFGCTNQPIMASAENMAVYW